MDSLSGAFDYIILGAGSAGCILAARLAREFPRGRILLVEAGGEIAPDHETVWEPTRWLLVSREEALEWGCWSVPQPELGHRRLPMLRARALGGCSVHNAMVYVRGGRYGFDQWARSGCPGWDFASLLPCFEWVEGRLHLTRAAPDPFFEDLVAACGHQGIPSTPDASSSPDAFGVSLGQFVIGPQGRRQTTYSVFLGDQSPANLSIASGVRFERILFQSRRARGVVVTDSRTGRQAEVSARREILVAAGAIGSPHLLMLSGVGPEAHLRDLGIPVVSALPGVGENFQDDLLVTSVFLSRKPLPPQPHGLMGSVIFTSTDPATLPVRTDVQFSLASGTMAGLELPPEWRRSYVLTPNLQLLGSRGTVTLASTDPAEPPVIDPRYLSAPGDLERCIAGLKLSRAIGHDRALAEWFAGEVLPGPDVQTDAQLEAYVRQTVDTCCHFAGTCRMGSDERAVVTPALEVRGVEGLRVIDASVIPTTVSGNTAAATMMIAARGAELVLRGS
jgi:choline dehydrogenase